MSKMEPTKVKYWKPEDFKKNHPAPMETLGHQLGIMQTNLQAPSPSPAKRTQKTTTNADIVRLIHRQTSIAADLLASSKKSTNEDWSLKLLGMASSILESVVYLELQLLGKES